MKLTSELSTKYLKQDSTLVHFYCSAENGYVEINPPVLAKDFTCPYCQNQKFCTMTHYLDHAKKVWVCSPPCLPSMLKKSSDNTKVAPPTKKAIEWPLFCEINNIGDEHHNVSFDKLDQGAGKIEYLAKFSKNPYGILFMRGGTGTGKTYAAMSCCEFFTRTSLSCQYMTHHQLYEKWIDSFNADLKSNFSAKLSHLSLLVIDDFGLGEFSEKFLTFLMDLINTRLQWSNRGTIITTNLDNSQLVIMCGDALVDRLSTGQLMEFTGNSRRTKKIL